MNEQVAEWYCHCYPTGACVVTTGLAGRPWFYVNFEEVGTKNRIVIGRQIASYLNLQRHRPAWFADMERVSAEVIAGIDGTSVTASGPVFDADPPNLKWQEVVTPEAVKARGQLMDLLFSIGPRKILGKPE